MGVWWNSDVLDAFQNEQTNKQTGLGVPLKYRSTMYIFCSPIPQHGLQRGKKEWQTYGIRNPGVIFVLGAKKWFPFQIPAHILCKSQKINALSLKRKGKMATILPSFAHGRNLQHVKNLKPILDSLGHCSQSTTMFSSHFPYFSADCHMDVRCMAAWPSSVNTMFSVRWAQVESVWRPHQNSCQSGLEKGE